MEESMSAFKDEVILITGASEGIGRALAKALAPLGPRLVLAARNAERLESLAGEVEAAGAKALVVPTDVTDRAQCEALVDRAVEVYHGLDVVVNNAGGTMWARFDELEDLDVFERLMRLNFFSAVYVTHRALPHLKESKGLIVGVSSVAGLTGIPTRTAYSASKHAMFGFFDALRVELEPHGVGVTMVAPDFVVTEIHRRALGPDGKPLGQSPLKEGKVMTAHQAAALMVKAMERRQRLLLMSTRTRLGRWLKLVSPGLVDRIAARAIEQKH